jgi:hypothetical protein
LNKDFEKRSREVFEVLSLLVKIDKQIIFLGGSAIQATLPEQKRLSIDLDISYAGDTEKLIRGLEANGYEIIKRQSRNPIFVFYTLTKGGVIVKLDISRFNISETEERVIKGFEVLLPTQHYLIASKLSSLAFNTIGRLKEEQSQIVKDIFDISCMLDNKPSLKDITQDWHKIVSDQNRLRGTSHNEVQCTEDVQKTLLKCVDVTPSPIFFITSNSLGSFQEMLVKDRILRQDLAVMAARTLLLMVKMGDEFYEIERRAIFDASNPKKLEEAEKNLLAKHAVKNDQLHALKITAPKALMYLFYWMEK